MKHNNKIYGWVNEKDGVSYYRNINDAKDEIEVKDKKVTKVKKKIKDIINGN